MLIHLQYVHTWTAEEKRGHRRMRERDRISLRKFREEEREREAREMEERERPIREAEAKLRETHRAIAKVMRQRLMEGRDPDLVDIDDPYSPGMTDTEVISENGRAAEMFMATNSWYYPCPENSKLIFSYLERNERNCLITVELLENIAIRMRDLGLLKEKPLEEQPEPHPQVNLEIEYTPTPPQPESFRGWDLETGQERDFTSFEVNRMSSETYARTFRLSRSGMVLAGRPDRYIPKYQR
jgi:hypothetical protein